MTKLQSILSTKEGQEQFQNIQQMLQKNEAPQTQASEPAANNGFDLSSLASLLGGGKTTAAATPPNTANPSNMDLSALAGLLGGNGASANPQPQGTGGVDLSALSGLLGANGGGQDTPEIPNIDMATILKLQQVFSSMNVNDKNSQLLLALKPHFSDKRQSKVDQAISMMRLFTMLPMLKESGIFAGI